MSPCNYSFSTHTSEIGGYEQLSPSDISEDTLVGSKSFNAAHDRTSLTRPGKDARRRWCLLVLFAFTILFAGFIGGAIIGNRGWTAEWTSRSQNSQCHSPFYRREWRSLSNEEKSAYIAAVRCLIEHPSITADQSNLYIDFPHIHLQQAKDAHYTPRFLPYHRYLIHAFESKLRSVCRYNGSLPYWNWSLDWESLETSPIFSSDTGFGGDGNTLFESPAPLSNCVADGPFAHLEVINPPGNPGGPKHCLSRGLSKSNTTGVVTVPGINPTAIEHLLRQDTFEAFHNELEHGVHKYIPNTIRGDFATFAAPNDPIWYLHHGQIDRLWWLWQQAEPSVRLRDYGKEHTKHSNATGASLNDVISIWPLAPNVTISDVISTESHVLCYRYLD